MTTWFRRTSESDALFAEERLVLAANELVYEAMHATGKNKKQLADLLKVRPTEVSNRLSGRRNLTLRSLARMMHALGFDVELRAIKYEKGSGSRSQREARIGERVSKEVVARPEPDVVRIWQAIFLAKLQGDIPGDEREVAKHISEVSSVLGTLDQVLAASVDRQMDGVVRLKLRVTAHDLLDAGNVSTSAIRAAIHTAGGNTPGWEKAVEDIVSKLSVEVAEVDTDAPDQTACSA
ncbi:helix-turn-helix domain-containing protein [Nocardia sp. NPDC050175]|uniref:helix-turn-helix domain-containing protein n=1 Tax=Nocardia sp. NPDC050175 TaxID=3364317 RepID=UPI00379EDC2A